ncbi:hypothetical protein [Streptomyces sp. DT203]|uniref:hypothetical protein n=1 Tax=Streptomyces sp. DT203 TaxID=3393424 RepID=UPI003CF3144C
MSAFVRGRVGHRAGTDSRLTYFDRRAELLHPATSREPGHRTGRIDYSTLTEQEAERTALFLGRLVDDARQEGRHGSAA